MFEFPTKMKRVFKDEQLQASFEEYGYVVVPSFYSSEEMEDLERLFYQFHKKEELRGFFSSTFSENLDYRVKADEKIRKIGSRSINSTLVNHKVVCGSFIVKAPDENSGMSVHQDMTLVDEREFTGINIWCPLIDLTEENGILMVLDKSHRIYPTYRGSSIPGIYEDVWEDILKLMKPVYLKAGDAIFFDQSIIHYSPPNKSDEPRIVTNTYFSHKEVKYQTAYCNPERPNQIELFEQDESFMTDFEQFGHNIKDRPKVGRSLGFVDYNFPKITVEELVQLYGLKLDIPEEKSGFFRNLFAKLKGI